MQGLRITLSPSVNFLLHGHPSKTNDADIVVVYLREDDVAHAGRLRASNRLQNVIFLTPADLSDTNLNCKLQHFSIHHLTAIFI